MNLKELQEIWGEYDLDAVLGFASVASDVSQLPSKQTEGFEAKDIGQVLLQYEGCNDYDDWVLVAKLKDGRYASIAAWCDYTGWDCRSDGTAYVADSYDKIIQLGLDDNNRKNLGISVN